MGKSMVHRNIMMMHMAFEGLSTIAIDVTKHTAWMFLQMWNARWMNILQEE